MTFVVAIAIFPLRESERPLFESIMPVVLTAATLVAAYRWFRHVHTRFVAEGLRVGLIWLTVNLALDALMFSWGPMQMSLLDYMKDIGVTYLIIPSVCIGAGYLAKFPHDGLQQG